MTDRPVAVPFGDGASRFSIPTGMSPRAVFETLRLLDGVDDVVVTETHACIYFDPSRARPDPITALEHPLDDGVVVPPALHIVRARYDGPDLDHVARVTGLACAEIGEIHAATEYEVRVVGFLPGFAYLATLDPRIAIPRRAVPRTRVPPGAIAIAGARTGIYPCASPGGWHLIGTAVEFAAFSTVDGSVFRLGDRVRFERVNP